MTKKKYKVLITASGVGAPLGELTKYTNKSLIKVGKKPVKSYIIESYPKSTEFVITVGHFSDQVKDFLRMVYPERNFTFVEVDMYKGAGSSLGHSMLQAEPFLQCPFIYHASDTIVTGAIQEPSSRNWVGGFRGAGSSNYASFDVLDGKLQQLHKKGMMSTDFLHIGLVGVKDYEAFWKILNELHGSGRYRRSLGDVDVLQEMLRQGFEFHVHEFGEWHDTGNVETLNQARLKIADSFHILHKVDESIFLFDKFVVKFFADKNLVKKRVKRAEVLKGLVPKIESSSDNFYRYRYVDGQLYSDMAAPGDFRGFLEWSKKKLWKESREVSAKKFREVCHDFYVTKTEERVRKFLASRSVRDTETVINGERVPSVKELLKAVDFEWLCDGEQRNFHGDFILDNILKTKNGYVLLDWRQDFGGLIRSGDMYYDLAKLNHNLTVNHGIVNDNLFTVGVEGDRISCDILRKENLVQCQRELFRFLETEQLDKDKVRVLTAIIWLNMSPLHHHPFDLFLFYFGKLNLWRALQEKKR